MKRSYVAAVLFCAAGVLLAQDAGSTYYYNTDSLAKICRTDIRVSDNLNSATAADMVNGASCATYVEGVLDTFEAARKWNWIPKAESVCVPGNVKSDQAVRIFLKYVDGHPEELNKAAPSVLWSAMHNAFPCPVN